MHDGIGGADSGMLAVFITLLAGLLLVAVAGAIGAARRKRAADQRVCPKLGCGHVNVQGARFCARCGARLTNDA